MGMAGSASHVASQWIEQVASPTVCPFKGKAGLLNERLLAMNNAAAAFMRQPMFQAQHVSELKKDVEALSSHVG